MKAKLNVLFNLNALISRINTVPTSESESESESGSESESVAHLGYVSSSLYPGCKAISTRFKSYTFLAGLRAEIQQF